MNRSKDRHVVAYCFCREDRGRHTHRGIHSSSHGSRRRYLSDAYLVKSPILKEITQRHNSRVIDVSSALHQSEIPCSKGEILFKGISKAFRQGEKPQGEIVAAFRQGEQPQGEFKQGEQPQEENDPLSLMLKGRDSHIDVIDDY
jgi:hypothetical protein